MKFGFCGMTFCERGHIGRSEHFQALYASSRFSPVLDVFEALIEVCSRSGNSKRRAGIADEQQ